MGQSTEELTQQIADTRENLAEDLDALGNRVSPHAVLQRRKAAATGRLQRARSRLMGTASDLQQAVSSSADSMTSTTTSAARGAASGAMSSAEEKYEGSPLAAGLVAFGAGMVLSALLPPTEAETRAARQVVDVAREKGQPVVDEAKGPAQEAAQEAAQNLKQTASEAAQQVKETATRSATDLQDEGKAAAEQVKSEAQGPSTGG